jgi:hypothetical protein
MLEYNNVGAFSPFVRIDPVRLYRYTSAYWQVLLVSEVGHRLWFPDLVQWILVDVRRVHCHLLRVAHQSLAANGHARLCAVGHDYHYLAHIALLSSSLWTLVDVSMFACMIATLGFYIQMQLITSDISNDVIESGGSQYVQLGVS